MSRYLLNLVALVCILGCLPSASAQDQPTSPPSVSHINPATVAADQTRQADDQRVKAESDTHKEQFVPHFVAKELEGGRVINTREYSVRTYADFAHYAEAQIRTGARVPVSSGGNPRAETLSSSTILMLASTSIFTKSSYRVLTSTWR